MDIKILEILNEIKSLLQDKPSMHWLDIKQASQHASVSQSTIRRAIQSGQLRASKVVGKWLIKSQWIENYLTN